ncbi:MAG: anti-sigma factor family protein [Pyrinomonadaceae bacterium]
MSLDGKKSIGCSEFEENLSDYLDKTLGQETNQAAAEHVLKCPLCHSLLNEVKELLDVCVELKAPGIPLSQLEANVLALTTPEIGMVCEEFENHLTDYLDGFLPATIFHRWERHAVICPCCTDLPGEVVRSIAACYTYKMEELEVPAGLNSKILVATIGSDVPASVRPSFGARAYEWLSGLSLPISASQLAPIAMLLLIAVLVFSQTAASTGSIGGVYQKSIELAGQTYKQGTDVVLGNGSTVEPQNNVAPSDAIEIKNER